MTRAAATRRPLALAAFAAIAALAVLVLAGCSPAVQAELKTYDGINAIRRQNGLPPLQPDPGLVAVARVRSADMAAKGYFSHQPPDGCNFVCLMDRMGVPHAYAGENIAWNNWPWDQTADRAVLMWKNSPPHLENILNCHYERFGTGVAQAADGRIYYTMIFDGNANC